MYAQTTLVLKKMQKNSGELFDVYIPEELVTAFRSEIDDATGPVFVSRASSCVEILGTHLDYNGGIVLASTIDRCVWVLGSQSEEVHLHSLQSNRGIRFKVGDAKTQTSSAWIDYLKGVFWAFSRRNHNVHGLGGVIYGNDQWENSRRSLVALEVSLASIIAQISSLRLHPKALAMLAFEAERLYCNVSGSLVNQFTAQLGKSNALLGIHCTNLLTQDVAMSSDVKFVTISPMIEKSANDILEKRKNECIQALTIIREAGGDIPNLSAIAPEEVEKLSEIMSENLTRRVGYVVTENHRVREGIGALKNLEFERFGRLLSDSHISARDLYEISHPRIELLREITQRHKGVLGSRLTGIEQNESLLILLKQSDVDSAVESIQQEYERETGIHTKASVCSIPGGVVVEEIESV